MPMALPLLAAAGTAMAGYAAATAVGATLASQVIGGVMIAGAAMTAVGAVTGNQRLMQIGGIASLAGGVAGLASGAWEATASTPAEQAAKEGAVAFEHGAGAYAGAAEASSSSIGALSASEFAGLQNPAYGVAAAGQDVAAPVAAGSVAPGAAIPTAATTPGAAVTGVTGVPNPAATVPNPSAALTKPAIAVNGGGSVGSGVLDSVKSAIKWATATPENARLAQGGLGILSSGLSAYGQQEAIKEQMALQEAQRQRQIDRLNESVKGVRAMPVYVRRGS